jgi:hypothetical protein
MFLSKAHPPQRLSYHGQQAGRVQSRRETRQGPIRATPLVSLVLAIRDATPRPRPRSMGGRKVRTPIWHLRCGWCLIQQTERARTTVSVHKWAHPRHRASSAEDIASLTWIARRLAGSTAWKSFKTPHEGGRAVLVTRSVATLIVPARYPIL